MHAQRASERASMIPTELQACNDSEAFKASKIVSDLGGLLLLPPTRNTASANLPHLPRSVGILDRIGFAQSVVGRAKL